MHVLEGMEEGGEPFVGEHDELAYGGVRQGTDEEGCAHASTGRHLTAYGGAQLDDVADALEGVYATQGGDDLVLQRDFCLLVEDEVED